MSFEDRYEKERMAFAKFRDLHASCVETLNGEKELLERTIKMLRRDNKHLKGQLEAKESINSRELEGLHRITAERDDLKQSKKEALSIANRLNRLLDSEQEDYIVPNWFLTWFKELKEILEGK